MTKVEPCSATLEKSMLKDKLYLKEDNQEGIQHLLEIFVCPQHVMNHENLGYPNCYLIVVVQAVNKKDNILIQTGVASDHS